ncbi:MAG: DUF3788 family protein [Melioribacteraceae bacterium]|nr:DUF3788 domain-containing protein [Melioribacteraceae bacterium]WKZ69372.1 MAG: DUF3788 family protein [Melioribacteraceae bacterium]
MPQPTLTNKDQFPTEEIIFSHIGNSKVIWEELFKHIHTEHPDLIHEWRYYNDGKSWLMKVTRKSKTIFWLSVIKNAFQITFYFGDKAEHTLLESSISEKLKKEFKEGKRFGKIRGITLVMNKKQYLKDAKELINLKISLK